MNPLMAVSLAEMTPIIIFVTVVGMVWALVTLFSKKQSKAEERFLRMGQGRPMEEEPESAKRFSGLREAIAQLGVAVEGKSDLEKNKLKTRLANAGFRSESAPLIYNGLRVLIIGLVLIPTAGVMLLTEGFTQNALIYSLLAGGLGFYIPQIGLHMLVSGRKKEIFLTLPDALDLLVVCVESGLGLDAAMRKVTEEMKDHAKTITEELNIANVQLQMGRTKREVLHDLGVRTGVDDVKALAAILIQADRFGSSIAQALRVQSDSMRTRRRQIAEEKAAKTAVQLIFPLVLFIFPAIFVVLVGPAAIQIQKGLLKGG